MAKNTISEKFNIDENSRMADVLRTKPNDRSVVGKIKDGVSAFL
jgi:hypothetical protein